MKQPIILSAFLITVILSSCLQGIVFAYHIRITPSKDNRYYQMKVNETVELVAEGIGWDEDSRVTLPNTEIMGLGWEFDSNFLEKLDSADNSLTLRAKRRGTTKLIIKGKIQDVFVTKSFSLVITIP